MRVSIILSIFCLSFFMSLSIVFFFVKIGEPREGAKLEGFDYVGVILFVEEFCDE